MASCGGRGSLTGNDGREKGDGDVASGSDVRKEKGAEAEQEGVVIDGGTAAAEKKKGEASLGVAM